MKQAETISVEAIDRWLDEQRERLFAAQAADHGAPELSRQVFDACAAYLRGCAQFAQQAGAAASAATSHPAWPFGAALEGQQWSRLLTEWLAQAPFLGPQREQAEAFRALLRAQQEYATCEQALRAEWLRIHGAALQLLEAHLRERTSPGSWREVYAQWVECGEQAYAQAAHSEAFIRLLSNLTAAQARWRERLQGVLEEVLTGFDLPTRAELNTVHRELRELRARVRELEGAAQKPGPER